MGMNQSEISKVFLVIVGKFYTWAKQNCFFSKCSFLANAFGIDIIFFMMPTLA